MSWRAKLAKQRQHLRAIDQLRETLDRLVDLHEQQGRSSAVLSITNGQCVVLRHLLQNDGNGMTYRGHRVNVIADVWKR